MVNRQIGQIDDLSLKATDKNGNVVSPIPFDAPPTWTVSDPTLADLTVSTDGVSAVLTYKVAGHLVVNLQGVIKGVPFAATAEVDIAAAAPSDTDVVAIEIVITPRTT